MQGKVGGKLPLLWIIRICSTAMLAKKLGLHVSFSCWGTRFLSKICLM